MPPKLPFQGRGPNVLEGWSPVLYQPRVDGWVAPEAAIPATRAQNGVTFGVPSSVPVANV